MSQSPTEVVSVVRAKKYFDAFDQMEQMVREGKSHSGREPKCCFLNTHGPRFANISAVSGLNFPDDGRALAVVDWDLDGKLDLWMANRTAPQVHFMHNVSQSGNHFLAVKLEGRTGNRDAIGARLELYLKGQPKLIKTLHAGEGFISQSSKWIHFGLGESPDIERLVVRWPGGKTPEEFHDLKPDTRYKVVQGTGKLDVWTPPSRAVHLEPSAIKIPAETDAARISLSARVPMPELPFTDANNRPSTVASFTGGPVLVNLWASWCGPCLKEMGEMSQHATELRATGLRIVALNIEGLGDPKSAGPDAVKAALTKMKFPFETGTASRDLVDKLELLYSLLFGRIKPFPVPTSFLFDADGALAAIYKGPIAVEQLVRDVQNLKGTPEQWRDRAVPFAGKWFSKPNPVRLRMIAEVFYEKGYTNDVVTLYRAGVRLNPKDVESLNNLGATLASSGNPAEAEANYRKALAANPRYVKTRYNIGLLLAQQKKLTEARAEFEEALRIKPDYAAAHNNLGVLLNALGQTAEAEKHFREAAQINPEDAESHNNWGAALTAQGKLADALTHCQEALRLNPDLADAHVNVGFILASQGKLADGIGHYHDALRLAPDNAQAHYNLALALHAQGKFADASAHYRDALRVKPGWPDAANSLAWLLATQPDEKLRRGAEAVQLAEQAARATEFKAPEILDTLAAAYAAVGKFPQAIETAQQALQLATTAGRPKVAAEIQARLKLYEAGRPYREPTGSANQ